MSTRVVQKVRNNHYLYEVESVHDPVTGRSSQKRKYIGKCDEEGNLLSERPQVQMVVRSLGLQYLMYSVAKSMDLETRIREVNGQLSGILLAYAIERSISRLPMKLTLDNIQKSVTPFLLGDDRACTNMDEHRMLDILDECRKNHEKRDPVCDSGGMFIMECLVSRDRGSPSSPDIQGVAGSRNTDSFCAYISMSMSDFVPESYHLGKRDMTVADVLVGITERLVGDVGKTVLVLEGSGKSLKSIENVIGAGLRYTRVESPYSPYSEMYICRYSGQSAGSRRMFFGNRLLSVTDRTEIVAGVECRHIVLLDEAEHVRSLTSVYSAIDSAETYFEREGRNVGVDNLKWYLASNNILQFFYVSADGDGTVRMVRNTDALRMVELMAGRTLITTNTDLPIEKLLEVHLVHGRLKGSIFLPYLMGHGIDSEYTAMEMHSLFLGDFVSLMLRGRFRAMMNGCNKLANMDEMDALHSLSNIYASFNGSKWTVSEVSEGQKKLFEALGIPVPTDEMVNQTYLRYHRRKI